MHFVVVDIILTISIGRKNMISRPSTKEILAASIKEIAASKPVDKITVKEIVQNCHMTPTTFYNHFTDKYDLINWIYNVKIAETMALLGSSLSFEQTMYRCIEILLEQEKFYANALKNTSGHTSFRRSTNTYSIELLMDCLKEKRGEDELSDELRFYVNFYMRAMSEAVVDWYLGHQQPGLDVLVKRMIAAMPSPLKPWLL